MFKKAFQKTMGHEGYYANVAGDRGGETYRGISRVHNPHWAGWRLVDMHKSKYTRVPHNTKFADPHLDSLVYQFFETHYWQKIYLHELCLIKGFEPLSYLIFDSYVHSGGQGIKFLQEAINSLMACEETPLKVDGVMGKKTLAAVQKQEPAHVYETMLDNRRAFLVTFCARPGNSKFLTGFMRRIESFT